MNLKVPYDREDLLKAIQELDEMEFDRDEINEKMEMLRKKLKDDLPDDQEVLAKKIAEYNNVSVARLKSSPLGEKWFDRYLQAVVERNIKRMSEAIRISELQAWALFLREVERPDPN